jgi:ABC-type glycerol-3-phosphate transport system permease component
MAALQPQSLIEKETNPIKKAYLKYKVKHSQKRLNRSWYGDVSLFIFLLIFGVFSAYPLIFTIGNAFKPLNEVFVFPPKLLPENPTIDNFIDLFNLMNNSYIPFTRYFFNTIFITLMGTVGHVIIASMCAYPLAKYNFPGKTLISTLIVYSLMFAPQVTNIPNYMTMSWLGLIDTQWAIILPAWQFTLGLYLMKQFMTTIPMSLIEAAKIDGASEFTIFWKVVMPQVKPAWLTLIILLFQRLWADNGGQFIYAEQLKPLSFALSQIVAGGIARTGTVAAVTLFMMIVPVVVFIISQSKIIDTMTHSGLK